MADHSRLGRGLAALMGDVGEEAQVNDVSRKPRRAPIENLQANPRNPRRNFTEAELNELAASIKERGIIQPIVARTLRGPGESYEIIAGERRWRAWRRRGGSRSRSRCEGRRSRRCSRGPTSPRRARRPGWRWEGRCSAGRGRSTAASRRIRRCGAGVVAGMHRGSPAPAGKAALRQRFQLHPRAITAASDRAPATADPTRSSTQR